jgi:threonine dehydratase
MKTLLEAIRPTVFIHSPKLSERFGCDVTIATETFQRTGSFKFRAAYNVALNTRNDVYLAASSGNFGQALALACKLLDKRCTVVMPQTSAQVKIDAVRSYGAVADLIDVRQISRWDRVLQLAEQHPGAYLASAYDDPLVIAGNATLGDEIAASGHNLDAVIAPVGGGGLASGIITGLRKTRSSTKVYGAEPLLGNDAAKSLQAGRIVENPVEPMTIADGARTPSLGKHNWAILKDGLAGIIEVSEDNIAAAARIHFADVNLKCEPTGALSLGALLENAAEFAGQKVCCVVSGGNVDAAVYTRIIGD